MGKHASALTHPLATSTRLPHQPQHGKWCAQHVWMQSTVSSVATHAKCREALERIPEPHFKHRFAQGILKEFRADDHADHCCHYLRPLDGGRMASQTAVRRASLCSCCIASKLPKKLTQAKARHDFGANHLSCSPLRTGWLKCWNRPPKTKSSLKRRRPMGLCALDRQAQ